MRRREKIGTLVNNERVLGQRKNSSYVHQTEGVSDGSGSISRRSLQEHAPHLLEEGKFYD